MCGEGRDPSTQCLEVKESEAMLQRARVCMCMEKTRAPLQENFWATLCATRLGVFDYGSIKYDACEMIQ